MSIPIRAGKVKIDKPTISPFVIQFKQMEQLKKELETLKKDIVALVNVHKEELSNTIKKVDKVIVEKGEEIDDYIGGIHYNIEELISRKESEADERLKGINIDKEKIIKEISDNIIVPVPKDGKDADPIDEEKIIDKILEKIPVPKDGKDADPIDKEEIIKNIIEHFKEGKIKISTKHIDGFEDSQSVLRNFIARGSLHGGGDTVAAGSGITITKDPATGKSIISNTVSSIIYSETPGGLIDGINKSYTTANSITKVIGLWINGEFIHSSEYTVSGSGFTMATALDASLSSSDFTILYV